MRPYIWGQKTRSHPMIVPMLIQSNGTQGLLLYIPTPAYEDVNLRRRNLNIFSQHLKRIKWMSVVVQIAMEQRNWHNITATLTKYCLWLREISLLLLAQQKHLALPPTLSPPLFIPKVSPLVRIHNNYLSELLVI